MRGISRIGVAALAGMVSLLGVSTAQAIDSDVTTSLTQPANTLIMPYDATADKASYMIVSNMSGVSAARDSVMTLWVWTDDMGMVQNEVLACLDLNQTIVQDASQTAPGTRGMVVVTAWEADADCEPIALVDNAIVGSYTFADIPEQFSYGNDAVGVGLGEDGFPVLPNSIVGGVDIQTFNPATLDDSSVVILSVSQSDTSLVISNDTMIGTEVAFYNNAGEMVPVSSGEFNNASFVSLKPGGGIIFSDSQINSSGFLRMNFSEGAIGGDSGNFVFGVHGQSVGQFGGSSNFKYTVIEPLT
jgi:hypothetical protein